MATYLCNGECGQFFDGDYHPPVVDPSNKLELMCESCAEETEDGKGCSEHFGTEVEE